MPTKPVSLAPAVVLVLSFAIVFGFGQVMGPAEDRGDTTPTTSTPGPSAAPPPETDWTMPPLAAPNYASYPSSTATSDAVPDGQGNGQSEARERFCVTVPHDKRPAETTSGPWEQQDPPDGDLFCAPDGAKAKPIVKLVSR